MGSTGSERAQSARSPRGPRCIAIVGPFQSGKTTLLEAILERTGTVQRAGRVADGSSVGDGSPEARAHCHGVELNAACVHFIDDRMTFLDCPGSIEFAARYTIDDFLDAQKARGELAVAMQRFHGDWDLMLTPGTAAQPFDVGRVMPDLPPGVTPLNENDWTWWTPFSFPFNLTQQPALVMGCGFSTAGLPLSLQLVAPNHREDLCFRAARAYEQVTPWGAMRPPIA